ncbi:hypothetical protein, partial [Okeania sp. SIO3B5]|uniref:hypothetical protein n=1 Tax=Okeania sp. SIO3B5 TaxID=2607811 RepID=UPI0025E79CD6
GRRQEAGGRRFSQECHLYFIHAPMLPDMILGVGPHTPHVITPMLPDFILTPCRHRGQKRR